MTVIATNVVNLRFRSASTEPPKANNRSINVVLKLMNPRRILVKPRQLVEVHPVADDKDEVRLELLDEAQGAVVGLLIVIRNVEVRQEH